MAIDGLTVVASGYGHKDTVDRAIAAISALGMTVVARVDHAAAAAKAGLELRPTEVLIFGNPKAGTPLMQAAQTVGIDLPLKILIWCDEQDKTWLAYNDPIWIGARHGLGEDQQMTIQKMAATLAASVKEAAG